MSYRQPGKAEDDLEVEEEENTFPVSPWYGPDNECPKCGAANDFAWDSSKRVETRRITVAKFCGPMQRKFIRWFPWPKRCSHEGTHLHQKCKKCKAEWVSYPLSHKPEE